MRRWFTVMAASALLAGAGACSDPPATQDLTDRWSLPPPATMFRPATGVCHETLPATGSIDDYRPIRCRELHVAETYHVGTGPDDPVAPSDGSAGSRAAYRECSAAAADFLGGPWRKARIGVHVTWPSREAWAGGARWFRCDVTQSDLDGMSDTGRTASLKGALKGPSPLRLGCFNPTVDSDDVRTMTPVPCIRKHQAEFVGLWTGPDIPYAQQRQDRTRSAAGCRSAIAAYTGVPDDGDVQYRTGWISFNPTKTEWLLGERRVRCFLWFSDRTLTRSLKNAGPSALPVR